MKTLVFMRTHFIDNSVLSEYKKLCNINNTDTILFIDNRSGFIKINDNNPIQKININGNNILCFLFNQEVFQSMDLPFYTFDLNNTDLGKVMWYNSDYPFYIIKKYFPDYDHYWQIEYDVFCNGKSYAPFFEKFENNDSDLLIQDYRSLKNSAENWPWEKQAEWIYADKEKFGSFFPVVRLSSKAIDFLKNKRKEHARIFESVKGNYMNRWLFCELFVPTELSNNGFKSMNLGENNLRYQPVYNLNKERIFENPDNKLYHPIK